MPMPRTLVRIIAVFIVTFFLQSIARAGDSRLSVPPLAKPPLGERWFGIFMGGERTGFGRQVTTAVDDGYEMTVEGSVRMVVLGFSREAASREVYRVGRDLALRSFRVEQVLDGTPQRLEGETTPAGVKIRLERGGSRKEKLLKTKGAVYPPPVLNLYPLLKGAVAGKRYKVTMLDVEGGSLKNVAITVQGSDTAAGGIQAVHMVNDLYPMVDNEVWVDRDGNTLRESVRDGLVETVAEDGDAGRRFLAEATLSRRDMILDFSLVRLNPPLERVRELKSLVINLEGIPREMSLPDGGGQSVRRLGDGSVQVTVEPVVPSAAPAGDSAPAVDAAALAPWLAPTDLLPADHPEIVATARRVIGDDASARGRLEKLVTWVSSYVKDSVTDAPSPLDTLASRTGNCQSHARLFVSLARAVGIPARFVSGLVSLDGKGLLYHSWAEVFVDGAWQQVDPAFDQVPADASHVKLVEGESPDRLAAIAAVVGRIKARVVDMR